MIPTLPKTVRGGLITMDPLRAISFFQITGPTWRISADG